MGIKENDICVIVGSKTIPDYFIGRYGIITKVYKSTGSVIIEISMRVNGRGSLSHTAIQSDLQVIGSMIPIADGDSNG